MLAPKTQDRLRVLVVDDELDTTDSAAMLLRLVGHDVETASSGQDAIARASTFRPQIAVLDLAMPAMDGYETARQIQRLALPKPPVLVALSGYGHLEARRKSAEAGFDPHLDKPVEPDIFEHFHLLVEEFHSKLDRLRQLRQQQVQMLPSFTNAHLQMG